MRITEYGVMVEGEAKAEALAANEPLCFWGGVDVTSGKIQDIHHVLCGECVTGKILCISYDRGSCSSSGVILEMMCQGTSPAGLLCVEAEPVLALGPIIGGKMFDRNMPMRTISKEVLEQIKNGDMITFTENEIIIESADR